MFKKLTYIAVMIVCVVFVTACGGEESVGGGSSRSTQNFDVLSHLSVEFSGIDGNGTAAVVVNDQNEMELAMMRAAGFNVTGTRADLTYTADFFVLASAIDWSISPSTNLTNGDTVTITLNLNQDTLTRYNMRVPTATRQHTVQGLSDLETLAELTPFPVSFNDFNYGELDTLMNIADEFINNQFSLDTTPDVVRSWFAQVTGNINAYFQVGQGQTTFELDIQIEPVKAYIFSPEYDPNRRNQVSYLLVVYSIETKAHNINHRTDAIYYANDTIYTSVRIPRVNFVDSELQLGNGRAGLGRPYNQNAILVVQSMFLSFDELYQEIISTHMHVENRNVEVLYLR